MRAPPRLSNSGICSLWPQSYREAMRRTPRRLRWCSEGFIRGSSIGRLKLFFAKWRDCPRASAVINAYEELAGRLSGGIWPVMTDNPGSYRQHVSLPSPCAAQRIGWASGLLTPMGSTGTRVWAHLIAKRGYQTVGIIVEQSLVGENYIRSRSSPRRRDQTHCRRIVPRPRKT
jgi:hypothetical protein